ncbi:anthrone oxygenase family protein [Nocardia shimofusensis]|uniref:anthrone oxygenase family protein n=1 Tax=Nocardia shimofusensis TaxID=228596 RepID=UPI0008377CBE|nr:anthrone oxygenase family protein [Nocardia shimofusensis]
MLDGIRVAALMAATVATGLMAGVFGIYAVAIMPGLRTTDDRTFIGSFQAIDRAIVNPLFLATFMGALILSAAAALLHLKDGDRSVLMWAAAAAVLYLIAVVITVAVHLPLNDALKAAGAPADMADPAAVRRAFDEARWVSWNIVRVVASSVAFGCLAWALVQWGRTR